MRKRIHQKVRSEAPKIRFWGRTHYQLSEKDAQALRKAASGHKRYLVHQEWREMVEEKSRFIPKIWNGVD